jgi:hypothetical protein
MRSAVRSALHPLGHDHLHNENVALVNRIVLLRAALEGVTNDNTELCRQLARVRAENRELRTELQKHKGGVADDSVVEPQAPHPIAPSI